ncbi:MAG TPA: Gfo/Idh/MocA family oxidoreductase, partial [bacterium]
HVLPGQRYVERLLKEGAIGDLRLVRLQHLSEALVGPNAPSHWRLDKEISGYNVMTLGIYSEILNRWVGRAKTVSATGRLFTSTRKDPETGEPRTVTIPDSVAVSGELMNGAHYQLMFSSVAPYSPGDFIEIYGSKGSIHYDVPNQRVLIGKQDKPKDVRVGKVVAKDTPTPVPIPVRERGEWHVEHDFASAIRYGTPVFPNFQDGVAYMEFVEAVGRSMEQGRTVTLPLP